MKFGMWTKRTKIYRSAQVSWPRFQGSICPLTKLPHFPSKTKDNYPKHYDQVLLVNPIPIYTICYGKEDHIHKVLIDTNGAKIHNDTILNVVHIIFISNLRLVPANKLLVFWAKYQAQPLATEILIKKLCNNKHI